MKLRLAICAFAALAAASPAFAHAYLQSSTPSAGSVLHAAPKTLLIIFTEDIEVPFSGVTVTDAMGMNDVAGKPQAVPGHANQLLVPLNIQMPGKITVTWHALSTDTHKTHGVFTFTVGGG
ncbi:MAG TPA: copper resistance protein CopC [Acidocella sp.]|jgi:methionine-rich copper-binding protein CopC|nr:copper resistance protein CopC [Acidocella sp.]